MIPTWLKIMESILFFDFVRNVITSFCFIYVSPYSKYYFLCIIIGIQIITIVVQSKFSRVLANKTAEVREQSGKYITSSNSISATY